MRSEKPTQFSLIRPTTIYPTCSVCKSEAAVVATFPAEFVYYDAGAVQAGGLVGRKTATSPVNVCGICAQQIVDHVALAERQPS